MSSISIEQEVLEATFNQNNNLLDACAITLAIYDYLLNLDAEGKKITWTTWLYAVMRYLALVLVILENSEYQNPIHTCTSNTLLSSGRRHTNSGNDVSTVDMCMIILLSKGF
ncbi:hypothetical protein CONPUDRAFT_68614 [Coniophora puteana RWD-64-598 SS2]|uniref:DUF6533 domain-containing protein n=1 Tax=Coniophora puteana (strain RWD-64-598) TaxID=741705 RepID=A0A5M3N3K5_CONPW|nr:uncharacterized protein CONPUDRAFT_68614 [Coniophora puteana RWD-64-598 SS2]EIW85980.1 hypothetical protein CONPUDRAFT_68614 [Coniophora puteana RWD-64-598 SS2]